MKVAITADFHFGVPGKLDDILWAAKVVREYCAAAKIDVVLILGDMFHDRKSIEIDVLTSVANFLEETSEKYCQKWITFPGNHDMFLRHSWAVNSLIPFRKHLTVINDIKLLTLNDKRFWVLPFIQYEKSYMRVLRKIEHQHEDGDVLLTHIGVRGATLNTCFLLKDWSVVNFGYSKFKKVFTGHFHTRQDLDKQVFYPGSPIPFKFDEGDVPHGFYVYDTLDDSQKFVNIWKAGKQFFPNETMPPQYHSVLDESVGSITEEDIKGNSIRIVLQHEYTFEQKRHMRERLVDLGAKSVSWMSLTQKVVKTANEIFDVGLSHRDFFDAWLEIDKKGIEGLDMKILRKVHDDVVQEGDELYTVEESEV